MSAVTGGEPVSDSQLWRHPRSWTMRSKLVASMLALFVAITLAVGVATVFALNTFLMSQLDQRVSTQGGGIGGGAGGRGGLGGASICDRLLTDSAVPGYGGPGFGEGSLRIFVCPSVVVGSVASGIDTATALTAPQLAAITSAKLGSTPTTVAVPSLGAYRLVRITHDDGDVQISGLPLSNAQDTVRELTLIFALVTAAGLVIVGVGGTWLVRANLRPLRRVASTATRVSHLPLDSGAVALAERVPAEDTDPRTEVGQVGAALNGLLDHVGAALNARHDSEMRVRQFVADASHELRTPLASIRGYAELSRREREPVPAGVRHALSRVESEATRMSVLVDDLLLLARLDAGRPLDKEPVDLTHLVVDAVSDAHAASPAHTWRMDLPDEPVFVDGDSARLQQIIGNLLANARTHTPDGTTVLARVEQSGGFATFSVEDDGPGVPAALQPNVFQRFARGDSSRSRGAGSTGLGLSIVSAVAAAHGGSVSLDSRPGHTLFSVSLPSLANASAEPELITSSTGPGPVAR